MEKAPGIEVVELRPEIRRVIWAAELIFSKFDEKLVITSTNRGKHKEGSLHFKNRAIDLRLPLDHIPEIAEGIREFIGPDYDVVVEANHIHVEHDPK